MPKDEDANEQEDVESTESSEEAEDEDGRMKTAAEVAGERAAERTAEAAAEGAADEETEEEAEEEAEEAPPTAEPERYEDALPPVTVPEMLKTFCSVLVGQGWQKLGLVMDPTTGDVAEDLEQARLAIDTLGVLIDKLEGHLTPEEKREFDAAIANLQINFVQRRNASQEGAGN